MRRKLNTTAVACGRWAQQCARMLDPETFRSEAGGVYWRFFETARHGQFDIATAAGEDWAPDPAALAHLESALVRLDELVAIALAAAEAAWVDNYKLPLRAREAWSLVRLHAEASGVLVLSLNEREVDLYSLWDVTLKDGRAINITKRNWGG